MAELINVAQTLSSMEVAEMVEKEHHKLMRDIRRYTKQFDESNFGCIDITGAKIAPDDFWMESSYVDKNNRKKPCYQITKLGCEFIAHKTTGAKGTAFTAKYIVRFHQMEEALKQGISSPELPAQSKSLVPLRKNIGWYYDNREAIDVVCDELNMTYSELYHHILHFIGQKYDLKAARRIYEKELGYRPEMPMDIVEYFPQLAEYATTILESYYRIATT